MKSSIALTTILASLGAANPLSNIEKLCKGEAGLCRADKPCCEWLFCKLHSQQQVPSESHAVLKEVLALHKSNAVRGFVVLPSLVAIITGCVPENNDLAPLSLGFQWNNGCVEDRRHCVHRKNFPRVVLGIDVLDCGPTTNGFALRATLVKTV
ncbi:hypothetical protein V490_05691 [Pseudogymnoascus sp. VKM F-3557]|nr:hypothetical protein V490_05691 [Pseudogymnoascus sp. VKM F-3557]